MILTEREFFEGAIRGLGEEEVDEDDLKEQEDAVADVVLPACCVGRISVSVPLEFATGGKGESKEGRTGVINADGVDELVEETSSTAPPLEDGDTLGTDVEGEQLDEECCSGR